MTATDLSKHSVFTKERCEFLDADGNVVAAGKRVGELYYLNCQEKQSAAVVQEGDVSQERLWDRRYGHLGRSEHEETGAG